MEQEIKNECLTRMEILNLSYRCKQAFKSGKVWESENYGALYELNNEEKEIRVQASNGHYRDYGLGDTFDPAGTTMTLEYDGIQGMLLYFGGI